MAIKKVYELSVDMKRTSVRVNVPVLVQGDSAEFRIRLADNGVALSTEELGGITSVTMQSGFDAQTIIETIGTLEGSVAVFRLQKGELFRSGTVQAMVQLADADDRISTLRFEYQVIPELSGNYIPGEQDITVFQRYMNDAQAKIDEMALVVEEVGATDVSQLTAQLAETGQETLNRTKSEKPMFVFWDDDGSREVVDLLKPVFTSENVPLTVAIAPTISEMTDAEMVDLQNNHGWEFTSHSYSHAHLNQLSETELDYELKESKSWLESRGLKCNSIAIPYGHFNDNVLTQARKYYRGIRYSERGINTVPLETALRIILMNEDATVDAETGFARNSLAHYKSIVDKAISEKALVVFMSHSWAFDSEKLADLQSLIQYIKSKNAEIVTINDALNQMGNVVETGIFIKGGNPKPHFVLGANGQYYSNDRVTKMLLDVSKSENYYDYTHNTITHVAILSSEAANFPEQKAGILSTSKIGSNRSSAFSYQQYRTITGDKTWERFWDNPNLKWTDWKLISSITEKVDTYDGGSLPSAFPLGKISYTAVQATVAQSTGLPLAQAGTLINHRISSTGYQFQEYHIWGQNRIYRRYAISNTVWASWELIYPSTVISQATNSVNATTPMTSFPASAITYVKRSTGAGFPEEKAGMLMTNRISGDGGFSFQEYTVVESGNTYKRVWRSDGVWTEWKQFAMV